MMDDADGIEKSMQILAMLRLVGVTDKDSVCPSQEYEQ